MAWSRRAGRPMCVESWHSREAAHKSGEPEAKSALERIFVLIETRHFGIGRSHRLCRPCEVLLIQTGLLIRPAQEPRGTYPVINTARLRSFPCRRLRPSPSGSSRGSSRARNC
jgi:hypothetical protein